MKIRSDWSVCPGGLGVGDEFGFGRCAWIAPAVTEMTLSDSKSWIKKRDKKGILFMSRHDLKLLLSLFSLLKTCGSMRVQLLDVALRHDDACRLYSDEHESIHFRQQPMHCAWVTRPHHSLSPDPEGIQLSGWHPDFWVASMPLLVKRRVSRL